MTRTKKVLGLLLALAMVFGCMTMAFATDPGADARAATITVASTATELAAGETATITVSATTNFTASTASIPVFYNKTLVSVSDVTAAADTIGTAVVKTDATAVDSTLVYANTGYSADEYGYVLVQFTAADGDTVADTLSNVALVTFTVTALADVEGDATVVVPATALKTTSNANGKLYFGCATEGTLVGEVPELVSNIDTTAATATITVGDSYVCPTLAVKDDFAFAEYVVIDTANNNNGEYTGIVYGIDTLEWNPDFGPTGTLADALTTSEGDDYLVIEANAQGYESTGATITVLDSDGEVVETYVFVYFGDVDGDGMITGNDGFVAEIYEGTYEGLNSYAEFVAGDLDADGMVSGNDGFIMSSYEATYEDVDFQYNIGQMAMNNVYEWIY